MRYFFHYRDAGRYVTDTEGTELSDVGAATVEARQSVRELLGTERGESDPAFSSGTYEICDEAGTMVAKVAFDQTGSIAT
jgi:hypothetical protein